MTTNPLLYMAPLKGITDSLFRKVFTSHFSGIDRAIAPFINPQSKPVYPSKLITDILPENNCSLALVPQIINSDIEGFVSLANQIYDLGYPEINWNLGCPVRMVAHKKRGAGLMPHPDVITELLDQAIPRLKPALSIKMRLGYNDSQESMILLPLLKDYPLTEIIIHARLGKQLYRGTVDLENFSRCCSLVTHNLVYNGDITTLAFYRELAGRFHSVKGWMIGRGLLSNPFLATEIKGILYSEDERREKLCAFHDDLFSSLKQRLSGPGHLLGRMKQVWIYFIGAFPGQEKNLKKITRVSTEKNYLKAVHKIMGG